MFLLFQYTLCRIFVLVLFKKLLYLFFFSKENPLDNFSALRLMILSICSAIDTVFHTHYCHVWPSAGTSPTVWLLPGDHLSSLYDGYNGKRHCEAHLFFIFFYVFGTAVYAVSYFTFWTELFLSVGCLQCSVYLLLSIWSVGWKLKSATTFCPCVPFVVIHSVLHCYPRFLFCIILFWTFQCSS